MSVRLLPLQPADSTPSQTPPSSGDPSVSFADVFDQSNRVDRRSGKSASDNPEPKDNNKIEKQSDRGRERDSDGAREVPGSRNVDQSDQSDHPDSKVEVEQRESEVAQEAEKPNKNNEKQADAAGDTNEQSTEPPVDSAEHVNVKQSLDAPATKSGGTAVIPESDEEQSDVEQVDESANQAVKANQDNSETELPVEVIAAQQDEAKSSQAGLEPEGQLAGLNAGSARSDGKATQESASQTAQVDAGGQAQSEQVVVPSQAGNQSADGDENSSGSATQQFSAELPNQQGNSEGKSGAFSISNLTPVAEAAPSEPAASLAPSPAMATRSESPAATQQAQPAPSELRDDANIARVARGLQSAINQRGGQVTLRLDPPELGQVRIEMAVRDGVVNARITAATESVRRLLTDQLGHLRHALDRQGLSIERLDVQSASSSNTGWNASQEDHHDGRSRGQHGSSQQRSQRQPGEQESDRQPDSFEAQLSREN